MAELTFDVIFESVLGSFDRIPPRKPKITEIEIAAPILERQNGKTSWDVRVDE